ncbi:hypothetical protein ACUNWD_07110 [Sunxiuqinia sp. A32]|uniref:hypothetical protein n=1 Tax=Sunxiuqinia sp. A32 TaxID=3461496 RepID=UPI00404522F7
MKAIVKKKITDAFEELIQEMIRDHCQNDPLLDGLIVQTAIANLYKSYKADTSLKQLGDFSESEYENIVDEVTTEMTQKYLE